MPQFAAIEFILAPGHHAQNDSARCTKCTKCRDLEPCRLSRYMQVPAGSRCRSTHPRLRPSQAYRPCQSPCSRSTHGVGLRRRRDIFMFTSNRDAQGRLVCFCFAACFRHLRGMTLAGYCIPPTTRAIDANPQALL